MKYVRLYNGHTSGILPNSLTVQSGDLAFGYQRGNYYYLIVFNAIITFMIDPTKIDMNQLPKKFCDGAIGAYGKEFFSFAITSGNSLDSFAATPQQMKSIAIWIDGQIKNYERQFGEIDMTPPQIQSPLQIADLKKPGSQ